MGPFFLVEPRGWGVAIETTYVGAEWLREFIRTKRISPADEELAVELYDKLTAALDA
jgi:hypothetical protein